MAQAIARRIERHGGAALVIDYGSAVAEPGDSLQALHRHEKQHALAAPGAADLTAHVDFAAIARAVRDAGIACHGPVTQAAFLDRLGIRERADRLAAGADARQRGDIEAALARLLGAREMGTLFKALAMVPRNAPVPAGFASDEGPRPAR